MSNMDKSVFQAIIGKHDVLEKQAVLGSENYSYNDLLKNSEELARILKSRGIRKRKLVGVSLYTGASYVLTILAVYRVGAISVLINPDLTDTEKAVIVDDSNISFIVDSGKFIHSIDSEKNVSKSTWNKIRIVGHLKNKKDVEGKPKDCLIIYTSGSTGRPKGVVLTDDSLSNNIIAVFKYLKLNSSDKTIVFTPSCYAYAVSQVFSHLYAGGAFLPYKHGLRYPIEILNLISEHSITGIAANPTSYKLLSNTISDKIRTFDHVNYLMSGGQPLDLMLVNKMRAVFPKAKIISMYGCTENSPRISYYYLPSDCSTENAIYPVGKPIEGTELRIVNESGDNLPINETGEVQIRGSSLMHRYWRNSDLTNKAFIKGWFCTKDLGYIDNNGNLNLTGRKDNIINVSHHKVSPEEIEETIRAVDGVSDVAVSALADPLSENVIVAVVVTKQNNLEENILMQCRKHLSKFKIPRHIIPVKHIPKNLYGKIDRIRLKKIVNDLKPFS
jgi:acyl-coenzyme A synthetase/AMP-(fatty) acid ligase